MGLVNYKKEVSQSLLVMVMVVLVLLEDNHHSSHLYNDFDCTLPSLGQN